MFTYIREGFRATVRQPFLLLILFLYRFCWGIVLYKLSQSVILPLLHRYPDQAEVDAQARLFLAEGQFVLFKTDISHSYLWLLLGLLVARMILTPVLNAGVYFSLAHTEFNSGYRFFRGIVELIRPYSLYYAIQMILTLAPLWWVLPELRDAVLGAGTITGLVKGAFPYAALMLLYGFLLHLLFLYIQLGRVTSGTLSQSIGTALRSLPLALGIAALILLVSSLAAMAVLGASVYWAGFWALVFYQAYRFVQTLFSVWGIAAQQQLYREKTGMV